MKVKARIKEHLKDAITLTTDMTLVCEYVVDGVETDFGGDWQCGIFREG